MEHRLYSSAETTEMILSGKKLILAADESVLTSLPVGNWIGGTIPYFIGENGGEFSKDKVFVTLVPDNAVSFDIKIYDSVGVKDVYKDAKSQGFSFIIIPAFSKTHSEFALNAPSFENFGFSPLIGWIAGFDLEEQGKSAKIFDGKSGKSFEDGAAVMAVELTKEEVVDIQILNVFYPGDGDAISFAEDGFSAQKAYVNGKEVFLSDYILENGIDTKIPLVADMYGAMINTSFKSIDTEKKIVHFYAPVYKGIEYKTGSPVGDYMSEFLGKLPDFKKPPIFSCNCILNYLYADLKGKKTGTARGPITFGEIAYQLLNQTMTYMTIEKIA